MRIHALPAIGMVFLLSVHPAYGQDTVTFISSDLFGKLDTIEVHYTKDANSDRTASFPGDLPGRFDLPVEPPGENLYDGSQFSRFVKAGDLFDVYSFPARTAVKLGTCKVSSQDTSGNKCSGTLVGDRFVLTSAHCVAGFGSTGLSHFRTGVKVSVAPLNGYCHPEIATTEVVRTYVIKDYVDPANFNNSMYPKDLLMDDMALLELREPIGRLAGWLGMGYYADSSLYRQKVVHKFAIPGGSALWPTQSPGNPSLYYNGDTLYYNYGLLDVADPLLGFYGNVDDGAQGQSGSSLFYTDNASVYEIYGTQTLWGGVGHVRLREKFFYGFKHIMESWTEWILGVEENPLAIEVYPNPVADALHIDVNDNFLPLEVRIVSIAGKEIETIRVDDSPTTLNLGYLSSGLYLMKVIHHQEVKTIKLVKK